MHIFIHSKNLHQAPISVFHQDPHVSGAVPALPAPTLTVLDVSKRCVSSSGTAVLRIGAQMAITNWRYTVCIGWCSNFEMGLYSGI